MDARRTSLRLALAVCALGCNTGWRALGGGPGGACALIARFEPPRGAFASSNEATLTLWIENRGAAPVRVDETLASPILGLAFADAAGHPVLTVPPGMPPANYVAPMRSIAAHGRTRFDVALGVFSPPLAPGGYTVRVRTLGTCSERGAFAIAR